MKDNKKKKQIEENILLKSKIILSGGEMFIPEDSEVPLEVENQFLSNVLGYENAEPQKLTDVLSINLIDWPKEETLTDSQLNEKLDELSLLMEKHNIFIALNENVPARVIYKFLLEDYLTDAESPIMLGMSWNIDGCSGNCEDCFQLPWCETGKELREKYKGDKEG